MDFATLAETDAEDFVGSDCEIAGWGLDESKLRNIMNIQGRTYFFETSQTILYNFLIVACFCLH